MLAATQSVRYESSEGGGLLGWFRRGKGKAEETVPAAGEEATPSTAAAAEKIIDSVAVTPENIDAIEAMVAPRTPGWMEKLYAAPSELNIEHINEAVQDAIRTHHRSGEAALANWQEVPLRPLRFKYEVVAQAMAACHTRLPNRLLNNVTTGYELAQALHDQAVATSPHAYVAQPASIEHKVARYFEEKVEELPPNVTFIKFNKQAKREVSKVIPA
ncbi:hypothetical protein SYNPS1DRAFT_27439 [Syncephalis pseudoplumigaleata]|uniref:Uncharacterized protein n=1 Tax=Syncephalis pseudoplumigaleata TaxID=1712513 RepID=A0A4P9Z498_9FUNG|nr:hypothetical protein SYNPS1DRAFT_27439 [Syncephalis pseudoplumigaleata]|eukprot:RKP26882.1 hypothetical protein SYNPS1DRAFT_27439 [Syncephalis pseudoplumigaleata]